VQHLESYYATNDYFKHELLITVTAKKVTKSTYL